MQTLHTPPSEKTTTLALIPEERAAGASSREAETRLAGPDGAALALAAGPARPCARLRVQAPGSPEALAYVGPDKLPYVIGRAPGPGGCGLLPDSAPPGTAAACSRRHLVLEAYDPAGGQFQVLNAAHRRNGTYDAAGRALPERFAWRAGERLRLGGLGEGSVWVRLEALP